MRCDDARFALSSRLDGEASTADDGEVNAHLAGCPMCRAWLAGAQRVTRLVRMQPVEVPDLTARILRAAREDGSLPGYGRGRGGAIGGVARGGGGLGLRRALGALAVVQLMLAMPELLGAVGHDAHAGREVAAFDIALAVGLLVVAWYPEYAKVFAPVAVTLVFCFAAISTVDMAEGAVTPGRVAIHGVAAAQALLLWRLARAARPQPAAA